MSDVVYPPNGHDLDPTILQKINKIFFQHFVDFFFLFFLSFKVGRQHDLGQSYICQKFPWVEMIGNEFMVPFY